MGEGMKSGKDPYYESVYIQTRNKKMKDLILEQKNVIAKINVLEDKLKPLIEKRNQIHLKYHELRREIEVESETGYPHSRKR